MIMPKHYVRRTPNSLPPTTAAQYAAVSAILERYPAHQGLRIGKDGPFLGVYFYPTPQSACAVLFRITKEGKETQI